MDYKIAIIIVLFFIAALASRLVFHMKPNNFVEKAAEEVIKEDIGHDFDIEEIVDCVEDLEPSDKKE